MAQTGCCPAAQLYEHNPSSQGNKGWEVGNDSEQSGLVTVWDHGNARAYNQTQSPHSDTHFHLGSAVRWEERGRKSKNKPPESPISFYSPFVISYTRCSWMKTSSAIILHERWSAATSWQYHKLYTIALKACWVCIGMFKKKNQGVTDLFPASKKKKKSKDMPCTGFSKIWSQKKN